MATAGPTSTGVGLGGVLSRTIARLPEITADDFPPVIDVSVFWLVAGMSPGVRQARSLQAAMRSHCGQILPVISPGASGRRELSSHDNPPTASTGDHAIQLYFHEILEIIFVVERGIFDWWYRLPSGQEQPV